MKKGEILMENKKSPLLVYREKMAELPSFIPLLEKQKADYLLVDSYSVTAEYFQELAKHITIPVAYIDDMGQEDLSVDTIINYGYGAEPRCEERNRRPRQLRRRPLPIFL